MGKKVIRLTESDLRQIVKKVITEQSEEKRMIRGIQKFLNTKKNVLGLKKDLEVDGLTGPGSETENAIELYQTWLNKNSKSTPTIVADGVWGEDTWRKMPPKDVSDLKKFIAMEGGLIDRLLHKIGL